MRGLSNLRTSGIAIVTILAMLIVPACGSLCAAMNHCSSSTSSVESDACHHANMSAQSDFGTLSSSAWCNQQLPLQAILVDSDSSVQLKSALAFASPTWIKKTDHASLAGQIHEFSSSNEKPQQSTRFERLSVLRI
jgi:hypothetical protein